jgi:hypothetical protein
MPKRKRFVHIFAWTLVCTWSSLSTAQDQATKPSFQLPTSVEGLPGTGALRNYPGFKELWERRRTAFSERVEADQNSLIFLGDSIEYCRIRIRVAT